jgi:FAD/FMN-containing dehydrogenase
MQNTAALKEFKAGLSGKLIQPGDSSYDDVRQIWNAMIDRKPALIVQCSGADDVVRAISFAKTHGLEISIRGAGHNIAGNSICDDGLMIDLSTMKTVRVDSDRRRACVEPGATLGDFDAAVQAHGLATPVGINSTTGIAGLTLGGGFGWLTRQYGMTVDNLISAEVVTAEAQKVTASETVNEDLFWALRGGGGNFGVVTQFEFHLHPVGPEILCGLVVYPFDQAREVLEQYRTFVSSAPEELSVWAVLRKAPPLPFLPEEAHGCEVVVLAVFYGGEPEQGKSQVEPLRRFGTPLGDNLGIQPYAAWQQAFDPLLTPGARNYWKSRNFGELHDGALDTAIDFAGRLPSPQCEIFLAHLDGAACRVPVEAMAYAHRNTKFVMNVHARWDDPQDDESCRDWARAFFTASEPYAEAGAYVNFMTGDESNLLAAAYGANQARLEQLKKRYDPQNIFHINQNIKPEA